MQRRVRGGPGPHAGNTQRRECLKKMNINRNEEVEVRDSQVVVKEKWLKSVKG